MKWVISVMGNQGKNVTVLGLLSVLLPVVIALLIINFFTGIIIMDQLQGLPIIMPLFICPIGAVLGFVSYRANKNKLSLIGIIANILLFLFPIVYNVLGTLIMGV